MRERQRVVVGMSGGVDSSVAAALLVEAGYEVIGVMLRLWSDAGHEDQNRCCTPDAMAAARRVAAQLSIPFYAMDVKDLFRRKVVQAFLDGYSAGVTPNPCIVCNRSIRWGFLLEQALGLGAQYFATGHYARVRVDETGLAHLYKGVDNRKDQSYVLSGLNQEQLRHTLLPLGDLEKPAVRELARKFGFSSAGRPDSQDLCFLGDEDYRGFLGRYAPTALRPGPIVTRSGQTVGVHQGLAAYTIGQRKGLGIAYSQPLYVIDKLTAQNLLVVGTLEELGAATMSLMDMNWISGSAPEQPFEADIKIRYKAEFALARVSVLENGTAQVHFEKALRDITPGQLAVCYTGEEVIGSGTIAQTSQPQGDLL